MDDYADEMVKAVQEVALDLQEHFGDLDDQEDAVFGEYARVERTGSGLIVRHQTEPWGLEITIVARPGAGLTGGKVNDDDS